MLLDWNLKIKMDHRLNYYSGKYAEDIVAKKYSDSGFEILGRRVRKSEGEIDIIAGYKKRIYFIEVKKSKTFAMASERVSNQQIMRIRNSALQFLCDNGHKMETEIRFDVALVDAFWRVKIIVNAF